MATPLRPRWFAPSVTLATTDRTVYTETSAMGLPAEASDGPQGPRDRALPERTEHSGWDHDDIRSAKTKQHFARARAAIPFRALRSPRSAESRRSRPWQRGRGVSGCRRIEAIVSAPGGSAKPRRPRTDATSPLRSPPLAMLHGQRDRGETRGRDASAAVLLLSDCGKRGRRRRRAAGLLLLNVMNEGGAARGGSWLKAVGPPRRTT
jgi:hypothetical protein